MLWLFILVSSILGFLAGFANKSRGDFFRQTIGGLLQVLLNLTTICLLGASFALFEWRQALFALFVVLGVAFNLGGKQAQRGS